MSTIPLTVLTSADADPILAVTLRLSEHDAHIVWDALDSYKGPIGQALNDLHQTLADALFPEPPDGDEPVDADDGSPYEW